MKPTAVPQADGDDGPDETVWYSLDGDRLGAPRPPAGDPDWRERVYGKGREQYHVSDITRRDDQVFGNPRTFPFPGDAAERKNAPLITGVLDYFKNALYEVAKVSKAGNDQHNPGQPLHWAREKSTDHADCIGRHLAERGTIDTDGQRHSAKLVWRTLALLQTELEAEYEAEQVARQQQAQGLVDDLPEIIHEPRGFHLDGYPIRCGQCRVDHSEYRNGGLYYCAECAANQQETK